MDLLVKNGRVITATEDRVADIAVDGGQIVAVAPGIEPDGGKVIDAEGKLVFPGFIDPHTHMELPVSGTVSSDDFLSGTRAAAAGGITTIIDFCSQVPGQTFEEAVGLWKERAGKAVVDYAFHIIVPQLLPAQVDRLGDLVAEGITSVKCMMAYKRGPQGSDDANLMRVLLKAREVGMLPMVHAENGDAIDVQVDRFLAEGKTSPRYHPLSRPPLVEAEAVNRAGALAALADYCVYVVHLSSAAALDTVTAAREKGWSVFAETCPQYLTLDDSVYDTDDFVAARYVCSPPLRARGNQGPLWDGLAGGTLRLVASDHCPFTLAQKEAGRHDFSLIPNGIPSIEVMFPLLFSRGVGSGRISLQRFVELSSTNAARMFGLYPQKGEIAEGADADLVVFDPDASSIITPASLHSNVEYTPYEGFELHGVPSATIARGEVLWEDGQLTESARSGRGRFVRRRTWTGDPLA